MAFSAKHLCFLVFIFLISSTVIQARESKFFSRFSHYQKPDTANTTTTKENELNQEQVPSVKPEEGQTSNGYGLYGHDSNQFPSTTTQEYTYPNHLGKTSAEEYTGGSYEEEEVNTKGNFGDNNKQYGMSDARFMDNPNNNGYETKQNKQYRMSDTRFMDNPNVNNNNNNGYETKQYDTSDASFVENNNNGYETKQYGGKVETGNRFMDNGGLNNNNGYKTKQYGTGFAETGNNNKYYDEERSKPQGLSDTRFMENGKYFYNVNNEDSYLNNYQPVNRRYDGFNPSQVVTSRNNYNYGNGEKEYESNGQSQYQGEENQDGFSP